mgnify:CR=1 FL=1
MMAGEILQVDKPGRIYAEPADIRVAEFIGSPKINILPGQVGAGGIVTAPAGMVMGRVELVPGTHLRVGIRWRPCEGADFADETCPLDAPPLLRCSKNLAMRRQGAKTSAVPKQSDWLAGCMRTLSRPRVAEGRVLRAAGCVQRNRANRPASSRTLSYSLPPFPMVVSPSSVQAPGEQP